MTPQQMQILANARSMLGARWSHQGRRTDRTDCLGLVLYAAKEQGVENIDIPSDYDRHAAPDAMLSVCRRHLIEITRAELQPADLLVLRYSTTNHIGLVGDYPIDGHLSIIHAQATAPHCVVENRFDDDWMRMVGARLTGCFRFPERVQ